MPELNQERVDQIRSELSRVRDARIDLLPEQGTLVEVIADALNALEVAYIMLADQARRTTPLTPTKDTVFVPVSNPGDIKKL